jgi:hypothetical protein
VGGGGWVVVVVIVWKLDLQLHMQLVSVTTNVVSSNPTPGEYSLQHNMICFLRVLRFPPQVKLTATI